MTAVCVSVCVSVPRHIPVLLQGSRCNFGEWKGVPPSCALLGGFAIGARVSLLWQHMRLMRNVCGCSLTRSIKLTGCQLLSHTANRVNAEFLLHLSIFKSYFLSKSVFVFGCFFIFVTLGKLNWLFIRFSSHVKYIRYRIITELCDFYRAQ